MEGRGERLEDNFENVYKGPIAFNIPSEEESKREAVRMWGEKIGSQKPSFVPRVNDWIRCIRPHFDFRFRLDLKDFVDHAESVWNNRLLFPNAQGLIVLRNLDMILNFIPIFTFVFGFDDKNRLYYAKDVGYQIPVLYKIKKGVYEYLVEPYNTYIEQDEVLAFYETRGN